MPNQKKFLDQNGLEYLCTKLSEYPDNEILKAVIDSIDETKQDKLPLIINNKYLHTNASTGELEWVSISSSETGGAAWGSITGTLNDQTDLKNILNSKQPNLPLGNANTYLHRNSSNNLEWTKINAPQIIVSATQPQDQVTGDWWYYAPEPTVIELDYFKLDNMSSLEVITDY